MQRYGSQNEKYLTKRHSPQSWYKKKSADLKTEWLEKKSKLAAAAPTKVKKRLIYEMADTCTHLARLNGGIIGDVARGIGGTLVSPPSNVSDVKRYFGDVKKLPQVDDLLRVLQHGVPAETKQSQADLKTALEYGNHRTIQDHLPQIWEKLADDVGRNRCLVFKKESSSRIGTRQGRLLRSRGY